MVGYVQSEGPIDMTMSRPIAQCHTSQTRMLAGLLFEFMMPGQRHTSFSRFLSPPFRRNEKIQRGKTRIAQRFKNAYRDQPFADYLEHGRFTLPFESDDLRVSPRDIPIEQIFPEFRTSLVVLDWIHSANNYASFGNARIGDAATQWIVASDTARKEALFYDERISSTNDDDSMDPLTQSIILAAGQDWDMRLQKRRKKIIWLCKEALAQEKELIKRRKKQTINENLGLTVEDAKYMCHLLDTEII